MSAETMVWKVIGIAVTFLTAAAPIYVAYDLANLGPIPERRLELKKVTPLNLMKDLELFGVGERTKLSVTIDGETYDNLVIAQGQFRNLGAAPILPTDYYEKLSVTVVEPWRIVAVENPTMVPPDVELKWKKITDTVFEAEPTLLNPGDIATAIVYLTNTQPWKAIDDEPKLEWRVRISNLRAFTHPKSHWDKVAEDRAWINIQLGGWALPFVVLSAALFQALYVHLLIKAGFLLEWTPVSYALVVASGVASFVVAEAISTYLFGSYLTDYFGVNHWLNAPPIIFQIIVLAFLWWRSKAIRVQP